MIYTFCGRIISFCKTLSWGRFSVFNSKMALANEEIVFVPWFLFFEEDYKPKNRE